MDFITFKNEFLDIIKVLEDSDLELPITDCAKIFYELCDTDEKNKKLIMFVMAIDQIKKIGGFDSVFYEPIIRYWKRASSS